MALHLYCCFYRMSSRVFENSMRIQATSNGRSVPGKLTLPVATQSFSTPGFDYRLITHYIFSMDLCSNSPSQLPYLCDDSCFCLNLLYLLRLELGPCNNTPTENSRTHIRLDRIITRLHPQQAEGSWIALAVEAHAASGQCQLEQQQHRTTAMSPVSANCGGHLPPSSFAAVVIAVEAYASQHLPLSAGPTSMLIQAASRTLTRPALTFFVPPLLELLYLSELLLQRAHPLLTRITISISTTHTHTRQLQQQQQQQQQQHRTAEPWLQSQFACTAVIMNAVYQLVLLPPPLLLPLPSLPPLPCLP